ncbi:MAG: amidase [Pseudooceanicola sp.]|nr:amidase [Pseudooceanicola sp.]
MTLNRRPATDLIHDLSSGALGAEELMRATLDRIAEANPAVNAVVALRDADDLLAEARMKDSGPKTGALHGLPIAVKDLVNVKGIVSCMGSPALRDFVPKTDDIIAARMRAAGAILIGKTNSPEFGLGSHTFNPVYGVTRNPYDTARSCGGSSGGAAVALATGMTALADGSDMMGSLRNPAGWNNVYGFRPSWGRVPGEPVGDSFLHQLATLGPMARSPQDLGVLLDVISGPDPRLPHPYASAPVAPVAAGDLKGKRIGWLGDWGGALPTEAGILDVSEAALRVFEALGAIVEPVKPPFAAEAMWESWITLRSWSVAANLSAQPRASLKDSAIWELDRGLGMSAMEVHRASVVRSEWFRAAARLFQDYDALVLPSAQMWPFDAELDWPREVAGVRMDTYHRWMQVVVPVSLLGLPALAVPAGFGDNGLPAGIQLFGPRGSDSALVAMGAAYHAATEWPQKRPAMEG